MSATSSLSSNALNFMSAMKNGVDERTGLYTVSINFPEIPSNDLRGPGFALAMAYSPLNPLDSGYGFGWNLQLSQYTPSNGILSLSTGETFKVTGTGGINDRLVMKEQKLDTFHFYQDGATRYRVVHKSGLVEILEVRGSQQNPMALPVEIYSPTGHRITLGYKAFNSAYQILDWIKDDLDQTLLTINRESGFIELLIRPHDGPEGGPLARYVMMLESSSMYVSRINLPTEDLASWRFEYRLIREQLCITAVETPGGSREEITYGDLGHYFPAGSGHEPLPRVTRHLTKPGFNQPPIDIRYTYKSDEPNAPDRNFLGFGTNISWSDDGLDNLYKWLSDYEYVCVETLWVTDEPTQEVPSPVARAVRKIERKYNRFHLLTHAITTQNKNIETVENTYYLTPNLPYEQQQKYCQLPKEIRTIWSVSGTNRRRTETEGKTYDSFGNLLVHTQTTGVVETSTWYPATQSDGCPADPEGFVRHLKERTVTPATSPNGNAPTLRLRHRYKALPALHGSSRANWITLESQTQVHVEKVLKDGKEEDIETVMERTDYEYADRYEDPFLHGRVIRQYQTLNNKTTFMNFDYEKVESPDFGVPVHQTTERLTTSFDDVSRAIIRQHSLITSQELASIIDGVKSLVFYDALNRRTHERVDSEDYPAGRQYEYILSTRPGQQAEHLSINAKGVRTRSVFDGMARLIFQERDHVASDNPTRSEQTYAAMYDGWGNLIEKVEFDWYEGKSLEFKTRFFYDDWAQRCRVVGPDNVETHTIVDPIGTDDWRGPIHRSWTQSAGPSPVKSGMSETWLTLFNKPERVRNLKATGEEYATESYLYDGLGRTTEHSDASKYVTRFVYDSWSRLISSTLADESVVTRTYADHSNLELSVGLTVNSDGVTDINVGEREFDGLGRVTRLTTGTRTERFAYEDDKLQVKTRTTPANDPIEYEYNLILTGRPVSSRAPDENVAFSFDPISGRLTQAINEQGTREYDFNVANQLVSERWIDQQQKSWETLYFSSMRGRQWKRTDVKQEGGEGLDTVYDYDECGRVISIDQSQLQVRFEYNNLSQLSCTTTKDIAANTTLVKKLEYDDQGREILRTLILDQHPARTQAQIWQVDGLLECRHLQRDGATLLKETFAYDARGRLTSHSCEGSTLPRDSEGREMMKQTFRFDALDNITLVVTTFPVGKPERAVFKYSRLDPCQLTSIQYSPERPTGNPTFAYNANGCQLNDERGNSLTYDSQNRLLRVENAAGQVTSKYWYDGHDHLVNAQQDNQSETLRFYQNEQLTNVVQDDRKTQLLYHDAQPLGQQQADDTSQTLLLLTDANHSVLGESQQKELRTAVYSAYGDRHSEKPLSSLRAFNGEVLEDTGWYLLGRGYRAYNPGLMRFHSPDSFSPFGSGGLNPYTYCLGNPIALRDPTGHSSSGRLKRPDEGAVAGLPEGNGSNWMTWVGIAIGAVFLGPGVVVVAGASGFALILGIIALVLAVAALILNVHSAITGNKDTAQAGFITGLGSAGLQIGNAAYQSVTKVTAAVVAQTADDTVGAAAGSVAGVADDFADDALNLWDELPFREEGSLSASATPASTPYSTPTGTLSGAPVAPKAPPPVPPRPTNPLFSVSPSASLSAGSTQGTRSRSVWGTITKTFGRFFGRSRAQRSEKPVNPFESLEVKDFNHAKEGTKPIKSAIKEIRPDHPWWDFRNN